MSQTMLVVEVSFFVDVGVSKFAPVSGNISHASTSSLRIRHDPYILYIYIYIYQREREGAYHIVRERTAAHIIKML